MGANFDRDGFVSFGSAEDYAMELADTGYGVVLSMYETETWPTRIVYVRFAVYVDDSVPSGTVVLQDNS